MERQFRIRKVSVVSVLLCLILAPPFSLAMETAAASYSRSEQFVLNSTETGDDYIIQVRLPAGYSSSTDNYPVLYVLDGEKTFGMAVDTVEWLGWAEEIEELSVIGIAYEDSRNWRQKRSRDFTPVRDAGNPWGQFPDAGGADKYQGFLREELIPLIDQSYRTRRNERGLAGISFAGLFGAYTLFTDPGLFNAYILIAPALIWGEKAMWQLEDAYHKRSGTLKAKVFTAVGSEDEASIIEPWLSFNDLVQSRGYSHLYWQSQEVPEEGHISVIPGALSRGIRIIFNRDSSNQ